MTCRCVQRPTSAACACDLCNLQSTTYRAWCLLATRSWFVGYHNPFQLHIRRLLQPPHDLPGHVHVRKVVALRTCALAVHQLELIV